MNILYVSHLTEAISEGPNYSVPAQIKAQSKYDNVFWWNLSAAVQQHWVDTGVFHGISDYAEKKISSLPKPFNTPDLVVFESFYYIDDVYLSKECRRKNIPYIIVPRSALTIQGQKKKRLKKIPANMFFFKPMTRHSLAIQYLTKKEFTDSGKKWCKQYFIIPNGVDKKTVPEYKNKKMLKGVYIGRFDPYQKGLDLLFEACISCKDSMREKNVVIELYGPERYNCRKQFQEQIEKEGVSDLLVNKEGVFGEEKKHVLENADFFVMTSRFEGMPLSLIEAMSYGLPCLITEGTNMREVVSEYKAGWTADTNSKSVSQALMNMLKDIPVFDEKSKNAWKLSTQYNWDSIAKSTHIQYENLIQRRI